MSQERIGLQRIRTKAPGAACWEWVARNTIQIEKVRWGLGCGSGYRGPCKPLNKGDISLLYTPLQAQLHFTLKLTSTKRSRMRWGGSPRMGGQM